MTTTSTESAIEREVKNQVCIEGHLQAAFDAILDMDEPDAIHARLVELAHKAVEMSFAARASGSAAPAPTPEALMEKLYAEGFVREEDWFVKNAGEVFIEQIHIDTLTALTRPAADPSQETP